jgi:Fe-S-cluster containining protein
MEQLIQHEHCLKCRECCRFRKDRQYFAPIFTQEEITAIQQVRSDLPEFKPYKGSATVFQVTLNRSKLDDPVYQYVCPFLDEDNYACTVYETRPFDCRTWPFIVMHDQKPDSAVLAHFTGEVCLGLNEAEPTAFDAYKRYFAKLMLSEPYRNFLRAHRALIWDHEEEGPYRTVVIEDLSDALSP